MAVIPFAPRRRSVVRAASEEARQPAEILFFTGVRYERQSEPMPVPEPSRRSPRATTRGKPVAKSAGQPA